MPCQQLTYVAIQGQPRCQGLARLTAPSPPQRAWRILRSGPDVPVMR